MIDIELDIIERISWKSFTSILMIILDYKLELKNKKYDI